MRYCRTLLRETFSSSLILCVFANYSQIFLSWCQEAEESQGFLMSHMLSHVVSGAFCASPLPLSHHLPGPERVLCSSF